MPIFESIQLRHDINLAGGRSLHAKANETADDVILVQAPQPLRGDRGFQLLTEQGLGDMHRGGPAGIVKGYYGNVAVSNERSAINRMDVSTLQALDRWALPSDITDVAQVDGQRDVYYAAAGALNAVDVRRAGVAGVVRPFACASRCVLTSGAGLRERELLIVDAQAEVFLVDTGNGTSGPRRAVPGIAPDAALRKVDTLLSTDGKGVWVAVQTPLVVSVALWSFEKLLGPGKDDAPDATLLIHLGQNVAGTQRGLVPARGGTAEHMRLTIRTVSAVEDEEIVDVVLTAARTKRVGAHAAYVAVQTRWGQMTYALASTDRRDNGSFAEVQAVHAMLAGGSSVTVLRDADDDTSGNFHLTKLKVALEDTSSDEDASEDEA
jgi:hypothetical protein